MCTYLHFRILLAVHEGRLIPYSGCTAFSTTHRFLPAFSPNFTSTPARSTQTSVPALPHSPVNNSQDNNSPLLQSPDSSFDRAIMTSTSVPTLPGLAALTTFIGSKDTLILEKGDLSPSIFDDFKNTALTFFRRTKVVNNHERVLVLLNSF